MFAPGNARTLTMAPSGHELVPAGSQVSTPTAPQMPLLCQASGTFPQVGMPPNQTLPPMGHPAVLQQFMQPLISSLSPMSYTGIVPAGVIHSNYPAAAAPPQLICDVRRSPYTQHYSDHSPAVLEMARKFNIDREILDMIIQQLEFYMSPVNIPTDHFLLKQMDEAHYVPLSCFATFPKINNFLPHLDLSDRTELVMQLFKSCPLVQVSRDETRVRVSKEITFLLDTLELRGLPENIPYHELKSIFPTCDTLEYAGHGDMWVVTFKNSHDAIEQYKSITNKTLRFRQMVFYVRFRTKSRSLNSNDDEMRSDLFYVKSGSDWNAEQQQQLLVQRQQRHQQQVQSHYPSPPTSTPLYIGQTPQQQQLAAYSMQQQRQYFFSPPFFFHTNVILNSSNLQPAYILQTATAPPQHAINLQHHHHPTPQQISAAPPTMALATPTLAPQSQQFVPGAHQAGIIHHHHHHPNAAGKLSSDFSSNGAGRSNGQRRQSRGGRRGGGGGGQSQRLRMQQHLAPEDSSDFKMPHATAEASSTMVHINQK